MIFYMAWEIDFQKINRILFDFISDLLDPIYGYKHHFLLSGILLFINKINIDSN